MLYHVSRLQYFARGSQTYHAQLTAALKGKNALELKDEQVRNCSKHHTHCMMFESAALDIVFQYDRRT